MAHILINFKPRSFAFFCGLALLSLAGGCVSLSDNLQVRAPEQMDIFQRNVLDKCAPHALPHTVILADMRTSNPPVLGEGSEIVNQEGFDAIWNNITVRVEAGGSPQDTLKPVINWDERKVRFFPALFSNSCEKVKFLGLETNCYQININLYKYVEGRNCGTPTSYPVFIIIYPKSPLPMQSVWIKTPGATPTP